MRDIYLNPNFNKIDQGLIFNAAIASNYQGRDVFGVIISPRCDIAHKKNAEIHYLPVVYLKDWLAIDGKLIFVDKIRPNLVNNLKSELEKEKITSSILNNNKPNELLEIIEKLNINKGKKDKIIDIVNRIIELDKVLDNTLSQNKIAELFLKEVKQVKEIIKDLIGNKRKEFYLLDPINDKGLTNDYLVVLNREIKKINLEHAEKISYGLDLRTINEQERVFNDLNFENIDDLVYPIKIMKSPFIEHLLQQFLTNFNRIGVTDHSNNLSETITTKINYNEISFY